MPRDLVMIAFLSAGGMSLLALVIICSYCSLRCFILARSSMYSFAAAAHLASHNLYASRNTSHAVARFSVSLSAGPPA